MDKYEELKMKILSRLTELFPAPRDENGDPIPFFTDKNGVTREWPLDENGNLVHPDDLD